MAPDNEARLRVTADGSQAKTELDNVAAATRNVGTEAKGASGPTEQQSAAQRHAAASAKEATAGESSFAASLSSLKKELISLLAGHELLEFAREAIDAFKKLDDTNERLTTALRSQAKAAEEMKFAETVANDLGLATLRTADAYSKFAAASLAGGASLEQTRQVFLGAATAVKATGGGIEALEAALGAFQVAAQKTELDSRRLVIGLGSALPGALGRLAEAFGFVGDGTKSAQDKFLEFVGTVDSAKMPELLAKIGDALRKAFVEDAARAASGLDAQQVRLANAWEKIKLAFATGFSASVTNRLGEARDALSGAADAASRLGSIVGNTARIISSVLLFDLQLFDTVKTQILGAFDGIGSGAAKLFANIESWIGQLFETIAPVISKVNSGVGAALDAIGKQLESSAASWSKTADELFRDGQQKAEQLPAELEKLRTSFGTIGTAISDAFSGADEPVQRLVTTINTGLAPSIDNLGTNVAALATAADTAYAAFVKLQSASSDGTATPGGTSGDPASRSQADLQAQIKRTKEELEGLRSEPTTSEAQIQKVSELEKSLASLQSQLRQVANVQVYVADNFKSQEQVDKEAAAASDFLVASYKEEEAAIDQVVASSGDLQDSQHKVVESLREVYDESGNLVDIMPVLSNAAADASKDLIQVGDEGSKAVFKITNTTKDAVVALEEFRRTQEAGLAPAASQAEALDTVTTSATDLASAIGGSNGAGPAVDALATSFETSTDKAKALLEVVRQLNGELLITNQRAASVQLGGEGTGVDTGTEATN